MGDGDPIISAFIGLILGMSGAMVFIVLSFLLGGIYSSIMMLLKRKTIKQHIAFGPLLALSGMLIFLFGEQILDLYFKLIMK
jgi:prepilin signal peptidase PulO-like enzyme (type II secretory pathway)